MEASTNEDNEGTEIIWKIEGGQTAEDQNGGENIALSEDDDDYADEPDSEPEVIYQSGYIQNDAEGDEQMPEEPAEKRIRYQFETDPRTRKRHCRKLLTRLKLILDELSVRVGQQVAIIVAQPPNSAVRNIQTYGSTPLQDVVKRYHPTILSYLSEELARSEPPRLVDPRRFELPPLVMEGTPVPLERMTQAQLREFVPLMIRFSTGRGKPGWGLERTRPPWWPLDVPWQNVRLDSRDAEEKLKESWSDTLRRIIICCYKYHDREDLLREASGTYEEPSRSTRIVEESSESTSPPPNVKPDPEAAQASSAVQQVAYAQVVNNGGTVSLLMPKDATTTETREVILTDSEGREYCVQIAVPSAQPSVIGPFQLAQPEQLQDMPVVNGHVIISTPQ